MTGASGEATWLDPVAVAELPSWAAPLVAGIRTAGPADLLRMPPPDDAREGAVLVLLGHDGSGPDVLLIERAADMRSHPGQPAFPGGKVDPDDHDPVAAALREAREETGLDPSGVLVFGTLPRLWLPPSGFAVTPVLGWWREPSPVAPGDPAEVAGVHRVPVAELADPARRVSVRHPSGFVGPAFLVRGLTVWGFTAMLLDRLLHVGGWERPWDPDRVVPLPEA